MPQDFSLYLLFVSRYNDVLMCCRVGIGFRDLLRSTLKDASLLTDSFAKRQPDAALELLLTL